jgi:hypothetical protein
MPNPKWVIKFAILQQREFCSPEIELGLPRNLNFRAVKLFIKDEARRIAAKISKLADLSPQDAG